MTRCRHCDTTWTGLRIAHCGGEGGCHRTFTTPALFDKHRGGSRDLGLVAGECHDPTVRGMTQNERGQWGMPNDGGYDFGGDAA